MDMRFGTWNVRRLYSVGLLKTAASDLAEVSSEKGGSQPADDCTFLCGNGNASHHLGTVFFVHHRIRSAVKRVEIIGNRMLYIILRDRWCDVILNGYALPEEKSDDTKDSIYKEVKHVFDQFPKYHMNMLLGDFNAKVGREDILKPANVDESLH
jgi:hypothetical protein